MIHNIVIVKNKEYQAVNDFADKSCEGCALDAFNCRYAECERSKRKDGMEVVYKRHYQPSVDTLGKYAAFRATGVK